MMVFIDGDVGDVIRRMVGDEKMYKHVIIRSRMAECALTDAPSGISDQISGFMTL